MKILSVNLFRDAKAAIGTWNCVHEAVFDSVKSYQKPAQTNEYFGSDWTSIPDQWHFETDPGRDSALFVNYFKDTNKKYVSFYCLLHSFGTFTSVLKIRSHKTVEIQGFFLKEGSGSGAGSGSWRPKNLRIHSWNTGSEHGMNCKNAIQIQVNKEFLSNYCRLMDTVPGKNTVGMQDVEGLDPGVEELVLARLVAVELVRHGKLRVEAAGEDQLQHGKVLVGDCPAALQQLPHSPRVVAQPNQRKSVPHLDTNKKRSRSWSFDFLRRVFK